MDTNKMREQFEAKFETPHGVFWCDDRDRYLTTSAHVACVQHQGRWEGWQASREAVVVELPRITGHEYDPLADADYREGCREAIEAQGLKVAP